MMLFFLTYLTTTLGLLDSTIYQAQLFLLLLRLEEMMLALFTSFSLWVLKFSPLGFSLPLINLIALSAYETTMNLFPPVSTICTYETKYPTKMNTQQC